MDQISWFGLKLVALEILFCKFCAYLKYLNITTNKLFYMCLMITVKLFENCLYRLQLN